jgi:DNA replication protein DnaC
MNSTMLIEDHLRSLRLSAMLANYRRLLDGEPDALPYLENLVSLEVSKRHENGVKVRIAAARFPTTKTIEAFDFTLQAKLPKAKLLAHFDGSFIDTHRNVVFYGNSGTGKTHCLISLGVAACMKGYRVRFITAAELLMQLMDAKREGALERKYRSFERIDLLAIDELGYIPFDREATDLLFQLISMRYERGSIALTTNLPFEEWTNVFPDARTAKAVIDRIIHHGTVFEFGGESYRLRTRNAGKPTNTK